MSFIYAQNVNIIDDDHKKLSLSKEIDFRIDAEILNT
jgi:hypothetical protein